MNIFFSFPTGQEIIEYLGAPFFRKVESLTTCVYGLFVDLYSSHRHVSLQRVVHMWTGSERDGVRGVEREG